MMLFDYQELAMRTCSIPHEKSFDKLVHGVTGLMSELEEVRLASDGKTHLIKELGDCTWMIAEICDSVEMPFCAAVTECEFHNSKDPSKARGELCGIVQKHYQGHEIDRNKVFDYTCEIMNYLLKIMKDNRINLNEVLETNIEKLRERYPEGFEAEKSLHREEGDV